jgi:TolA-binding protein
MAKFFLYTSLGLTFLALGACRTSRDLHEGRAGSRNTDPTGIKTLDAPPAESVFQSSGGVAIPESVQRQLVSAQGELEDLKFQRDLERREWQEKLEKLENENKKLHEALALREEAPPPAPTRPEGGTNTAELLWKQGVDAIQKKNDAAALVAFKSILSNYPKSKRVWGATLCAGMLEYRLKNYTGAAIHFNEAIDLSAKRSVGPSLPWYFQGLSFLKIGKKEDASLFFDELNRRFPRAVVNQKARAVLSGKARLPDDLFADVPNWLDFVSP